MTLKKHFTALELFRVKAKASITQIRSYFKKIKNILLDKRDYKNLKLFLAQNDLMKKEF